MKIEGKNMNTNDSKYPVIMAPVPPHKSDLNNL
jgi:hypothetical protein